MVKIEAAAIGAISVMAVAIALGCRRKQSRIIRVGVWGPDKESRDELKSRLVGQLKQNFLVVVQQCLQNLLKDRNLKKQDLDGVFRQEVGELQQSVSRCLSQILVLEGSNSFLVEGVDQDCNPDHLAGFDVVIRSESELLKFLQQKY